MTNEPSISSALEGALAEARALGFLGPGPLDAHVRSAAAFHRALTGIGASGPALDLGSGGGVPGLILAEWLPQWEWILLDAHRRRTSFLARAAAELSAGNVAVVRAKAEDEGHGALRASCGVVTARSFGPPPLTAEAAAPFLRVAGCLVVAEPPEDAARWDEDGLHKVGLVPVTSSPGVAVFRLTTTVDAAFPRPLKQQRAKPLW